MKTKRWVLSDPSLVFSAAYWCRLFRCWAASSDDIDDAFSSAIAVGVHNCKSQSRWCGPTVKGKQVYVVETG